MTQLMVQMDAYMKFLVTLIAQRENGRIFMGVIPIQHRLAIRIAISH